MQGECENRREINCNCGTPALCEAGAAWAAKLEKPAEISANRLTGSGNRPTELQIPPRDPQSLNGTTSSSGANTVDSSTITDVCSGTDLPEVEIISLLEEQIPRYKLRADTLTSFSGYENQDWSIPGPALTPSPKDSALTPEQIRETLNYFVLCSSRVSQMTKTYNDVEAVTRLLEEKEKDLELAAHIGQSLLSRNKALEDRIAAIEAELAAANETVTQLRYDLLMKAELLQIYSNDVDESGSEAGTPTGIRALTIDALQRRVRTLEEDNRKLRAEAHQLARDTTDCELKEDELVKDIVNQLAEANAHARDLAEELNKKYDDNSKQQEEISSLVTQLVELRAKIKQLTSENEELTFQLTVVRDCQNELALELAEYKDKYAEIEELLQDTQEQLRRFNRRGLPLAKSGSSLSGIFGSPLPSLSFPPESLASELELSSLGSDFGVHSETSTPRYNRNSRVQRVLETVRYVSKLQPVNPSSDGMPSIVAACSSSPAGPSSLHKPYWPVTDGSSSGFPSLESSLTIEPVTTVEAKQVPDDFKDYPTTSRAGIPGTPGTEDLKVAIKRLTPKEKLANRRQQQHTRGDAYGWRTPDSIMSTGSRSSYAGMNAWKLPNGLQIIKPLEGSATLNTWSRLARPHLGGVLEDIPGVATRGAKYVSSLNNSSSVESGNEYSLSDLEEDDDMINPGKSFEQAGSTFTYTNSIILHPDDLTRVTSALPSHAMLSIPPVCMNEPQNKEVAPTPPISRRNSVSTFSTHSALARVLHERGIQDWDTYRSRTCSPSGLSTPCNSPDGTPPGTPTRYSGSPSPWPEFLHKSVSSIRRTLLGESPPRPSHRMNQMTRADLQTLSNLKVMEKLEAMGLEQVLPTSQSVSPFILDRVRQSSKEESQNVKIALDFDDLTLPASNLTWSGVGEAPPPLAAAEVGELRIPACHGRTLSPGERRPTLPSSKYGIPGKPGSGAVEKRRNWQKNSLHEAQKSDKLNEGLNGISSFLPSAPDDHYASVGVSAAGSISETFVGAIGAIFFGRKGGLL